ncbi:hypothetical protein [Spiroplasma melliferum]|uniref:hypothetical protein n=1 Tax=Spiroplasma melliferum TaxID=2134 RepID=UPI00030BC858|nr:hypothetical protein [Spiroplasma melliferum]
MKNNPKKISVEDFTKIASKFKDKTFDSDCAVMFSTCNGSKLPYYFKHYLI